MNLEQQIEIGINKIIRHLEDVSRNVPSMIKTANFSEDGIKMCIYDFLSVFKPKLDRESSTWVSTEYFQRFEELNPKTLLSFPTTFSEVITAFRSALYVYAAEQIEARVFEYINSD